ncbi:hypothetical protein NU10_04770 [Flavobacterium dauae]|uniref:hypothetical protein n=1 Tax=Flavobacterium dauae TaxID=1563479 RepID=UPI00101B3E37|nr:hypothetical protein [Flavobacterium dauae]WLD24703.1 hypothetical protein NU10_04770 [Flavobacterium dauae]
MNNSLSKRLVQSKLHKPIKLIGAWWNKLIIENGSNAEGSVKTIYVISPYKTGTTYIASLWGEQYAKHEPYHMYSLKYLNKRNFTKNFQQRQNKLNIRIECSGFLSACIEKLPVSTQYIFILRPPISWIQSVLNHFFLLKDLGYNYIDEYYWKKELGYSLQNILLEANQVDLEIMIKDLYRIYLKYIHQCLRHPTVKFVEMKDLDDFAKKLGEEINVTPNFQKSWKRPSKFRYDKVDVKNIINEDAYNELIGSIPKEKYYLKT